MHQIKEKSRKWLKICTKMLKICSKCPNLAKHCQKLAENASNQPILIVMAKNCQKWAQNERKFKKIGYKLAQKCWKSAQNVPH